ncbi:UNVERIFIED_CONTAM: hypothetical protein Slati_1236300 [Sesamum latifolium]|uniref:Uncharacterized protein n=1 Tax=Sesamum latifolium TaxID=2727402 RepID=A0AAW2XIE1_9LAMI
MRRSFGGGGGGGMGGGSGGGGGMIRTVRRVVGGAPPEPFSPSANTTTTIASANSRKAKSFDRHRPTSPNTALTLSSSSSGNGSGSSNNGTSSFSSMINLPTSWGASPAPHDSEGVCVDASDQDATARTSGFYEDLVFGTVPSRDEVQHAVSALEQVVGPSSTRFPAGKLAEDAERGVVDEITSPLGSEKRVSLSEFEKDWVEPSLHLANSRMFQTYGSDRVYDAFHLLQTEPSVQRMVVSLSSDKAVWDAVLNNEMVKELRGSITQADNSLGESPDKGRDGSNPAKDILSWVLIHAKAKIMQLMDTITKLVNEAFQPQTERRKVRIEMV